MVTPQTVTQFISCDWGTSRLRLRLVELAQGRVLAEHATDATHATQPWRQVFDQRRLLVG